MKKVLIALGCVAFFGLSSCKKDYTCNCTVTDSNGNVVSESSTTIPDSKKKDAETACEGNEVSSGGMTASCELED